MSPASKSKSKDKSSRSAKEQTKVSSKPSPAPNSVGNGVPASAYNPLSGTFHTVDTTSGSLPASQHNGRFGTIDETEENSGSSFGTTGEFDSASNNDSCSGESEDQKEKLSSNSLSRLEPVPGCDTDKREKIRQKNEKKHQRQKERRAQELHERCSGYLMSRKLEILAQQLMAMGFSSEQATMALIQNEGSLEESVAWLFEGGEESKQQVPTDIEGGVNLKIDINDELDKITEIEIKFKCTKQEVERAVVASEGDLDKAEEFLKAQKHEPDARQKMEELGDPIPPSNFPNKLTVPVQTPVLRIPSNGMATVGIQQQRRDELEFSYPKPNANGTMSHESTNKNMQPLKKIQPRQQIAASVDKRWSISNPPSSISYTLSSPLQAAAVPMKSEPQYVMLNNDGKAKLQAGMLREPIVVMQRPQSVNTKQNPPSTSLSMNASPPTSTAWYSNGVSGIEMLKMANGSLGHGLLNLNFNGSNAQQFSQQNRFQHFVPSSVESSANGWGGSCTPSLQTSSLAVPSSLGLFSSWGSLGSSASSPINWSTAGSGPIDYTTIDWSLDTTLLTLLRPSARNDRLSNTWSTMFMGGKATRPVANTSGIFLAGLHDNNLATDTSGTAGSHEWTSPFAGKDLFRVPRQFVTSPSL